MIFIRVFFHIIALIIILPNAVNATDCSKLSPLVCLESVRCTFDYKKILGIDYNVVDGRLLICRREEGECEMAKNQMNLTKENCESNKNCKFIPASSCFHPCYYGNSCKVLYECSGGRPPNCVLK